MMMTMTSQQDAWRRLREEVLQRLQVEARSELRIAAIERTRAQFDRVGDAYQPKPYAFASPDDGVGFICAPIPPDAARRWQAMGEQVVAHLAPAYVNPHDTMHLTVCHTSHPDELMTGMKTRKTHEIAQLRAVAARFPPVQLRPTQVLLVQSGAIILLYEPVGTEHGEDSAATAHAMFAIDSLRLAVETEFAIFPKKQTHGIWHTTLARVLRPDLSQQAIDAARATCAALTEQLRDSGKTIVLDKLWYVDESHHYSAQGERTVIPLLGTSPVAS